MPKPNEIVIGLSRGGINLSINRTNLKYYHVNTLNQLLCIYVKRSGRQNMNVMSVAQYILCSGDTDTTETG